jgi:hypothetical protein
MSFKAPFNIKINSDWNELELTGTRNGLYTYTYTKSKTKKGRILQMKEEDLKKFINNNQNLK